MSTGYAIEHDSSRAGRWLRQRRLRFALWIAVIEAVLAAFTHDISRLTIVGAVYLTFVALLPEFLSSGFKVQSLPWIGPPLDAILPRVLADR